MLNVRGTRMTRGELRTYKDTSIIDKITPAIRTLAGQVGGKEQAKDSLLIEVVKIWKDAGSLQVASQMAPGTFGFTGFSEESGDAWGGAYDRWTQDPRSLYRKIDELISEAQKKAALTPGEVAAVAWMTAQRDKMQTEARMNQEGPLAQHPYAPLLDSVTLGVIDGAVDIRINMDAPVKLLFLLGTPGQREQYDATLHAQGGQGADEAQPRRAELEDMMPRDVKSEDIARLIRALSEDDCTAVVLAGRRIADAPHHAMWEQHRRAKSTPNQLMTARTRTYLRDAEGDKATVAEHALMGVLAGEHARAVETLCIPLLAYYVAMWYKIQAAAAPGFVWEGAAEARYATYTREDGTEGRAQLPKLQQMGDGMDAMIEGAMDVMAEQVHRYKLHGYTPANGYNVKNAGLRFLKPGYSAKDRDYECIADLRDQTVDFLAVLRPLARVKLLRDKFDQRAGERNTYTAELMYNTASGLLFDAKEAMRTLRKDVYDRESPHAKAAVTELLRTARQQLGFVNETTEKKRDQARERMRKLSARARDQAKDDLAREALDIKRQELALRRDAVKQTGKAARASASAARAEEKRQKRRAHEEAQPPRAGSPKRQALTCRHCGKAGHKATDCKSRKKVEGTALASICFNCGKAGHKSASCSASALLTSGRKLTWAEVKWIAGHEGFDTTSPLDAIDMAT